MPNFGIFKVKLCGPLYSTMIAGKILKILVPPLLVCSLLCFSIFGCVQWCVIINPVKMF